MCVSSHYYLLLEQSYSSDTVYWLCVIDILGMFSTDRSSKYGWGAMRLVSITLFCLYYFNLDGIIENYRYLSYVIIGGSGAIVNVNNKPNGKIYNMILLLICGINIGIDIYIYDAIVIVYLIKTMGGDFFASKLDTIEWQISGIFALLIAILSLFLMDDIIVEYCRIFLVLFFMQIFCEYGDNHYEKYVFFRHRYSFEIIHLLILFNLPNCTNIEKKLVILDLVACSAYRVFNYTIIVIVKLYVNDYFISMPRMILYYLRGFLYGKFMFEIHENGALYFWLHIRLCTSVYLYIYIYTYTSMSLLNGSYSCI